jgi:hypothetical protein
VSEREQLIEWLRSEIVGPSRPLTDPFVVQFAEREFSDPEPLRNGPLAWKPPTESNLQEVLFFDRESPHRRYGAGLLHPESLATPDIVASEATDAIGADFDDVSDGEGIDETFLAGEELSGLDAESQISDGSEDFEVTSPDIRRPSTVGISFCVTLQKDGRLVVKLPRYRRFAWQEKSAMPFSVNGRYESCKRNWITDEGAPKEGPAWRRLHAVPDKCEITVERSELVSRNVIVKDLPMPTDSPLRLQVKLYPRAVAGVSDAWIVTAVLRNSSGPEVAQMREAILYQTCFEVCAHGGQFDPYPESQRPFDQLDDDEQSLALLYRGNVTWAIGHGCSAGWDSDPNEKPLSIFAEIFPAVELPSMTPDIKVNDRAIELSMRSMTELSDDGTGEAWVALDSVVTAYRTWIERRRSEALSLRPNLAKVAERQLNACNECMNRIEAGLGLLKQNDRARKAFRLANLAMLLQQLSTKQLDRRQLRWDSVMQRVSPTGEHLSPWSIYKGNMEKPDRAGSWRAFQIAFLVMSLNGISDGSSAEREIVDLIWFPTGGGKTEAYLAVMAYQMFHERLSIDPTVHAPRRDGTNVLMRYTLRMLTTQQFQRAASLICSMEYLRRNVGVHGIKEIRGNRFSLGLWVGSEGSPNKVSDAVNKVMEFRRGDASGNPLVLTECPWCRSEIGRFDGTRPKTIQKRQWNDIITRGIQMHTDGPRLCCPDTECEFGRADPDSWLPIEVIDERIYRYPPSLVIATVDKLAMISFRPEAGALFGRQFLRGEVEQVFMPPSLIIQDELHLISGPLGSMYALYEGAIERLCSFRDRGKWIKPKLIASTATIRGAGSQVTTLYGRSETRLFPSPGVEMGDSFFGTYARDESGRLLPGRLYLGVHAADYGSILTTQVRAFSSVLFRAWRFKPDRRDPWWTLLCFYNSIRELGGAKTLFDSDIRSRLKFLFNREGFKQDDRRNLKIVEELTSRLSHGEIVQMMDRLATAYDDSGSKANLDACLASNIIEVGVDIDRLSLMGVVGQPKTTATYIQVTGRVGRRWWERPGLILTIYNPSKSRDRSHFEQFYSYHRRLYERVEPTTATPFAISALRRGLAGALIAWCRQNSNAPVQNRSAYAASLEDGVQILRDRCDVVQASTDRKRSLDEIDRLKDELEWKWKQNPQLWEEFPPKVLGEYLMLWPGQFVTQLQKRCGVVVPSSMRQVDRNAELQITQAYASGEENAANPCEGPSGDNVKSPPSA